MAQIDRPSPEDLLRAVNLEESRREQGQLKIFLGMAAGVGKTYAMLQEAQQLLKEKINVVIGVVDTHGRQETARLMEGLKSIPPKIIRYRDQHFEELDIDEILRQKPQIVLVDELAHSNIPGSRHAKRWQDVKEILDNGIDVYTTLNIQHIESLKDVVERIADIPIRETVPDDIVATAASIQLVDLSPDELLQRLKEGKVYLGNQSRIAAEHFFQEDRLTALREIVLRYTAEKVDHDLHGMVSTVERTTGWKPRERLLVAVSHSPHSKKLIRTTRRLAYNLGAPWVAVHVDDGTQLNPDEVATLESNLSLARELGAEVVTTNDPDIVEGLERISRQKGATQIVIGRPPKPTFFGYFQIPTLLDRLAIKCQHVDIHVIKQDKLWTPRFRRRSIEAASELTQGYSYTFAVLCVLLMTGASWLLLPMLGYRIIGFIFLLSILFLSLFVKKGPIFLASVLYAIVWSFLFIPTFDDNIVFFREDHALLALYLLTAVVTGILTDRAREHKEMLDRRETWTQALYEIVRYIASGASDEEILKSVEERLGMLLDGTLQIVVKNVSGGLPMGGSSLLNDAKERNAAIWVFENGKEAGWSTSTLPASQSLYLPLKGYYETVGVLIYHPNTAKTLTTDARNFLYTVGQQLGNYLERSFAAERARRLEERSHMDRIYQTVLKTVSVEFQSPVIDIRQAVIELDEAQGVVGKKVATGQIHRIQHASDGLLRTLDNVTAMAKVTGGLIPLELSHHTIQELFEACCQKARSVLNNHRLVIKVAEDVPSLSFDFALLKILVHNLILNAVGNSPDSSTIELATYRTGSFVAISVSDEGRGIPADKLEEIFTEFYRLPGTTGSGMGLGLALAQRIAEIHRGQLRAENRAEGGARFTLLLPMD